MINSICVFCGARLGHNPLFQQAAHDLGQTIAHHKKKLVYGGGRAGLMGVVADTALTHGAYVMGVIPYALERREIKHIELSEIHVVESMHERKAMMSDLADAYVALPGGFGTLEELFEVITWAQLGIHHKPILVLNIADYFTPILQMMQQGVEHGFIKDHSTELILSTDKVSDVIPLLENYIPHPEIPQWMNTQQI